MSVLIITILLTACIKKSISVCPKVPHILYTPAVFNNLEADYSHIDNQCKLYAIDAIKCKFSRFQDAENMHSISKIEKKLR